MTTTDGSRGRVQASYSQFYIQDLPVVTDRPEDAPLAAGLKLVETCTGLSPDETRQHVKSVRDKAFAICDYPCLGRWRFLHLFLPLHPEYPDILRRLRAGERLLDAGCCLGQVMRRLAADGAPAAGLTGVDITPEFIELGFELFRDRDRFGGRFVVGDVLGGAAEAAPSSSSSSSSSSPPSSSSSSSLAALDGQFDMIHASSLLHLFDWDEQVRLATRLVRLLRPGARGAVVVGRQVGEQEPLDLEAWRAAKAAGAGRRNYRHNVQTWQRLWDEVGGATGTRWEVSGELLDRTAENVPGWILQFTVKKVS